MLEQVFKIRHKPSGRFYKGSTYSYQRVNPKEYFEKIFTPQGKIYSKESWAKTAFKNLTDDYHLKKIFPWEKQDLEIVIYEIEEVGIV